MADHTAIFQVHTAKMPLARDVNLEELAAESLTQNMSGADISSVCREAAMFSLRSLRTLAEVGQLEANRVTSTHFRQAFAVAVGAGRLSA
jgi:transitional endoplasmic reticulum ATPase